MDCRNSRRRKRSSSITRNRIRALGNGNWQSRVGGVCWLGWQHPLYFTLSCLVCVLTLLVGACCRGQRETLLHYVLSFFFRSRFRILVLSYEEKGIFHSFPNDSLLFSFKSLLLRFFILPLPYSHSKGNHSSWGRFWCDERFCWNEMRRRRDSPTYLLPAARNEIYTVWHVTYNVELIICFLLVRGAKRRAVRNARRILRRVQDSSNLNSLFFRQSCVLWDNVGGRGN